MFVLGLDIGYSNLKIAYGNSEKGEMTTKLLPAGAGHINLMPRTLHSGVDDDVITVLIDDETWVAGVEPSRLQGWERELHDNYTTTNVYKALFHAALLISGETVIDRLVTGLPVSQALDETTRKSLIERLIGNHQVTPKRTVEVKEVVVVPQPVGAYMDIVSNTTDQETLDAVTEGKTVVIDPGFFSVDWVALDEGEVHYHSSDTSLKAMSRLLEAANNLIRDDHGGAPGVSTLEKQIRAGKDHTMVFGRKVALPEYIEKASELVSQDALTAMRSTMRDEGMNADVVLMAGGGAQAYEAAAQALFPNSNIVTPKEAVLSNARGFWHCGT